MASAPDTQSQSGSKKDKKSKKKKNAVVTTPSTVRYGPPPVTSTPGMPIGGQPVHPGGYPVAGAMYPAQPPMQPGMYPVYPGQPIVIQGGVPPPGQVPVMVPAGGVPVGPMVPQGGRPPPPGTQARPQQRQLDFTKAMSDFQTMFPTMDREVIETVLRANNGAVDETIDQLLTLSSDTSDTSRPMPPGPMPPGLMTGGPPGGHPLPPSQLPPDMFPSPGTTSFPDQPPPYSPPEPNSPFSQYNNNASTQQTPPATTQVTRPVPAPRRSIEPAYETTLHAAAAPRVPPRRQVDTASQNRSNEINAQRAASESSTRRRLSQLNTTRQWNPPMLGELPDDFLRMSATTAAAAGSPAMVTQTLQDRLDQNSIRRSSLSQQDPETNQILEDERIALFLQNEEFIQQLQRNPEFLSALERDYQDALEGGTVPDNESTTPATPATPAYPATPATPASPATPATPASPATPSSQTSNPAMASRPLPSTPAPELPARPPSFHGATPTSSQSSVYGASGSGAAAGAISMDDIEFRKKLDHMGKSSKTKFAILAGKFSKKKKTPKKYEVGSGGATDALLGESIYEELDENCLLEKKESRADDNMYAETM